MKKLIILISLTFPLLSQPQPQPLPNGWIGGTVVPSICSSGNSAAFYNFATFQLYECLNNTYIESVAGTNIFSILIYGADPSGIKDSTIAIQTAANYAIAANGTVFIPAGNYKVSSKVLLCKNWNYANVWGSGNGSVLAPTSTFPETSTDAQSAVFVTDCGVGNGNFNTPGAQPLFSGQVTLRDFSIVFNQDFSGSRTTLKHWTGLNLNSTLGLRVSHLRIVNAWDGISYKAVYSGGAWHSQVGQGYFEDIGINAYDIAVTIDGMFDSTTFNHMHIWPYGIGYFFNNWYTDVGVSAFQVGTATDLNISNSESSSGKGIVFVPGADGGVGFTKISNYDFDGEWGIDMSANAGYASGVSGHSVNVSNSVMSIGGIFNSSSGYFSPASSYYGIKYGIGSLIWSGGYISWGSFGGTGIGTPNPAIYIDATPSTTLGLITLTAMNWYLQNTTNLNFLQQISDTGVVQLNLVNNQFFSWNLLNTVPYISIGQSGAGQCRLTMLGNTFAATSYANVGLSITQDDVHVVTNNNWAWNGTNGWSTSFPVSHTQGIYQDYKGGYLNLMIDGSLPTLSFNDGTDKYSINCQSGNCYSDIFNPGGWVWRYNNGSSYVTNASIDYQGNWAFGGFLTNTGTTFAGLGTATAGKAIWCSNCSVATTCTGSGAGAWAFANGTKWTCPF